jgi:predicted secreted protein
MAHILGKLGQVDAAAEVTGIKSWTLDYTQDLVDVTDFDDAGVKTYIVGSSNWSGTFEGYKDATPLGLSAAPIALKLYESQTLNQFWSGNAYITGVHANVAHDGVVTYSYDYQGTGVLTVAAA